MSKSDEDNSEVENNEIQFEEIEEQSTEVDNELITEKVDEEAFEIENNDEADEEITQTEGEASKSKIQEKSVFVSQREIISIIFSKKTLYHVLVLFILLAFFGIISYTKSDLASTLILIFGYGGSLGYFVTAALNRFEEIRICLEVNHLLA